MSADREPIGVFLRWPPPAAAAEQHAYRLAGRAILSDTALPVLAPYQWAGPAPALPGLPRHAPTEPRDAPLTYHGPGWINDRWLAVECRWSSRGYRLSVAEAGLFWVARDGRTAALVEPAVDAVPATVVQALLGPALILALAAQGTWCLHAAAVTANGAAVAFLGETGNGKSTLAGFVGAEGGASWRRLADDVLPVELSPNGLDALPHFPQLKVRADAQPSIGMPERMPLRALYVLEAADPQQVNVDVRPMGRPEATLALARHTIAARLFDKRLMAEHLAFCVQAAAHVRVCRLSYPRRFEVLPSVRDAIAADLRRPAPNAPAG